MRYASDIGLLIALGIVIYLAASRLLGPPRRPVIPADLLAVMTGAADDADADLTRYGHSMAWRDAGGPAGADSTTGVCELCGGVAVVSRPAVEKRAGGTITSTQAAVTFNPPLAGDDQLLPCPGAVTG